MKHTGILVATCLGVNLVRPAHAFVAFPASLNAQSGGLNSLNVGQQLGNAQPHSYSSGHTAVRCSRNHRRRQRYVREEEGQRSRIIRWKVAMTSDVQAENCENGKLMHHRSRALLQRMRIRKWRCSVVRSTRSVCCSPMRWLFADVQTMQPAMAIQGRFEEECRALCNIRVQLLRSLPLFQLEH